jgi:putative Ca2+/H+ antiporter (TMEM165/GDT1 family)
MFEVVGLLIESLVGYVGGRFSSGKISIYVSSILVGLVFIF